MNQSTPSPSRWVEITFDCMPLRSIGRLDIPIDASPKFRAFCERVKAAIEKHGSHNTYYLHNAQAVFHLTNSPDLGMLEFAFEGTVFTGANDLETRKCEFEIELRRETCDWLSEPIVQWFEETLNRAVMAEFDRYIQAGDLQKTKQRLEELQQQADEAGGFMGMYL
ncbi:MAG: hypothetical protein NXI22_15015 [bacterium]|nr:hypothetical protein [bacterium]